MPGSVEVMQIAGFVRRNRLPVVLLLVSLFMYGYFALHNYYGSGLLYYTGDEPHYIVTTKSLVERGHLYVEEIYQDPRPEWTTWPHDWHAIRGQDGHFYSTHGIGLPLLAAPFYAMGGILGIILFTPLISALVSLFLYLGARRITDDPAVSFTTALVMGFATLQSSYSDQFYPELPMALLLLVAIYLFLKYGLTNRVQLAMGLLVGYGFLLKTAYAAIVAAFGLTILAISIRRRCLNFALFAAGAGLWFVILCFYNNMAFGNPFAYPLASEIATGRTGYDLILRGTAAYGATGLVFDRYYGILPYCPVLALAVLGLRPLAKKSQKAFALVVTSALAEYATASVFFVWWAGFSFPARYLVSILPLLGLPLSLAFKNNRAKLWFRTGMCCAVYVGLYLNLSMSWDRGIGLAVNPAKTDLLSMAYLGLDRLFPSIVVSSSNFANITTLEAFLFLSGLFAFVLLAMFENSVKRLMKPVIKLFSAGI